MVRFGQIGRLKPEMVEEYCRLHAAVWPAVLETIHNCNMRNYSIFLHGTLLFNYFEYVGTDYPADMEKMAQDPVTQKWWAVTDPCFETYAFSETSEFCEDMKEIFHFRGK